MSTPRPQPVLDAGLASAAATVLTGLIVAALARRGLLVPDSLAEPIADFIELGIVAIIGATGSVWAALWSRAKVTPLQDPRQDDGTPLRPPPAGNTHDGAHDDASPIRAPYPPSLATADTEVMPAVVDVAALRREYRLDP